MAKDIQVVVVDAAGTVRFASQGASTTFGAGGLRPGADVDDAFRGTGELGAWISEASHRARETGTGDRCFVQAGDDGAGVDFALTPTSDDGAFVVVASMSEPEPVEIATVSQRAWHDIKNQLGGLKLYATFLKIKLGGEDDMVRETTAKIVGGIDAIVHSIAEARRGIVQTKGEDA